MMSAIGTKRTCRVALHMSAFGGRADMTSHQMSNGLEQARTRIILKHLRMRTLPRSVSMLFVAGLIGQLEHAVSHQTGGWLLSSSARR